MELSAGLEVFGGHKEKITPGRIPMETAAVRTDRSVWTDALSGVSWASILAGAFVAAAISLALLALGAGLGLASVSPWSGSAVSGSTFTNITGAYLLMVAIMSSAIGGYLASRLRSRWTDLHTNEVFFRDSAHGLVAWAFATVLSATLLATASTSLVGGTVSAAGAGAGSQPANPNAVFVDRLFRPNTAQATPTGAATPAASPADTTTPATPGTGAATSTPPAAPNNNAARAEVVRLWTSSFTGASGLQPADRTYVAHLVAQQTGMSDADAQKRVDDVVNQTKDALERARQNAMKLAFWMTVALLFGAFAASLAAVEGGQHRDGTWNERRLVPRAW
jgi:hypothetical protein